FDLRGGGDPHTIARSRVNSLRTTRWRAVARAIVPGIPASTPLALSNLCPNATRAPCSSVPTPMGAIRELFHANQVDFSQIAPQAPREECPRMSVLIVGRLRTEWRRWKGQASGKPPRGRAARRRPQVEGLEDRALLTSVTEYPVPGLGN